MNAWIALMIGFALGVLAKWLFDRLMAGGEEKLTNQEMDLQARLEILAAENEDLRTTLQREPRVIVKEKDQLERINGIGPVFASRFNEAGIFTFIDLASVTPDQARSIINPRDWQAIEPERWISEARLLAVAPRS